MRPMHLTAVVAAAFLPAVGAAQTRADSIPSGAVGQNVEAVGYSNLNNRPGFKTSIRKVGERWYLYIGMPWTEGWQIVGAGVIGIVGACSADFRGIAMIKINSAA